MADEGQGSDQPGFDPGAGWQIRVRESAVPDWDAPRPAPVPPPPPPPDPIAAPDLNSFNGAPAPPPLLPPTPVPALSGLSRPSRRPLTAILVGVVLVVAVAGGGIYLMGQKSYGVVPLSTPLPSTVAVVHSGPAQLALQSLTGGAPGRTLKLSGSPEAILATPDRSKAFLLDTSHGDVIPVNLVTGRAGAPIPVGKLPVDEEMSADGSTLYITDNLGGTVIPINTATDRLEPAQPLSEGVDFYVPSPTASGALVGADTSPGQPGAIYFYDTATGSGTPLRFGANPVAFAFYSKDGTTAFAAESGTNGRPGLLFPIDVATHKAGTPITLGIAPATYALTPDGSTAVIANEASSSVSVVDLATRSLRATVVVGETPTSVAIDVTGRTAWVASALNHELVPVDLLTDHAGTAVNLSNAPGDLALPSAAGVAWVLFPSSNGSVNFLDGSTGPMGRSIRVGNGPGLLIGTGSETSWVANTLTNTVQRINAAGQSAGAPIPVFLAPEELKLTPDGGALIVLSYGDGVHSGVLTSINTTTGKRSAPINVGAAPSNLTLSPAGDFAYIADYQSNAVVVIDIPNWQVKGVLRVPCGPTDLAVTPDDTQLFVACADSSAIVPVKLPDYTLETPIGVASVRALVMPQTGSNLLIVGANGLETLDTETNTITKSVAETGNLIAVVETTDGSTILAVDNSGAALLLIDPTTLATKKSLAIGTRPDEVALSPDDLHAYVLDTSLQKLFVIDVATWKISATLGVSPDATDVDVPAPVVVPPTS
jgi:YVTN family beta-propeller protein